MPSDKIANQDQSEALYDRREKAVKLLDEFFKESNALLDDSDLDLVS